MYSACGQSFFVIFVLLTSRSEPPATWWAVRCSSAESLLLPDPPCHLLRPSRPCPDLTPWQGTQSRMSSPPNLDVNQQRKDTGSDSPLVIVPCRSPRRLCSEWVCKHMLCIDSWLAGVLPWALLVLLSGLHSLLCCRDPIFTGSSGEI